MRTLAAATLAAALVSLAAPGASASHVEADCKFDAISQDDVTGPDVWEAVAYGWAYADGETLAVRCAVYVNGQEAGSTPYGPARNDFTVTAGRITYSATADDRVDLCPVVTSTTHGELKTCPGARPFQLPPQWVFDAAGYVLDELTAASSVADAQLCPALAAQSPGTPPVAIDSTGDVYVGDVLVWDCPPYGWAG